MNPFITMFKLKSARRDVNTARWL